jgi:hypothetical protein
MFFESNFFYLLLCFCMKMKKFGRIFFRRKTVRTYEWNHKLNTSMDILVSMIERVMIMHYITRSFISSSHAYIRLGLCVCTWNDIESRFCNPHVVICLTKHHHHHHRSKCLVRFDSTKKTWKMEWFKIFSV